MKPLELNPEEAQMLSQVLRRCLSDLEVEILHTDKSEFKGLLKHRREVLQAVFGRLEAPPPTESA